MTQKHNSEFERLNESQQQNGMLRDLLGMIWANKLWWMLPIVGAIIIVGVIVALTSTGAAPFIYTTF